MLAVPLCLFAGVLGQLQPRCSSQPAACLTADQVLRNCYGNAVKQGKPIGCALKLGPCKKWCNKKACTCGGKNSVLDLRLVKPEWCYDHEDKKRKEASSLGVQLHTAAAQNCSVGPGS